MLKTDKLFSGYGRVTVVRDVRVEVQSGEIVALIGRNGVGKSTFIKTIMGLLKSNKGSVIFNKTDITHKDTYERARMGIAYVPQGHGVFPKLTVEENLKMGELINSKNKSQNYDFMFHHFPILKERLSQRAGTLSGGEQAQLAIGRALVGNPELLILDEPSEGIQPNIIQMIGKILFEINHDLGLTVLLVEQHIGLIQHVADRCYAMDKGTIVGNLEPEEIHNDNIIKKYLSV